MGSGIVTALRVEALQQGDIVIDARGALFQILGREGDALLTRDERGQLVTHQPPPKVLFRANRTLEETRT